MNLSIKDRYYLTEILTGAAITAKKANQYSKSVTDVKNKKMLNEVAKSITAFYEETLTVLEEGTNGRK